MEAKKLCRRGKSGVVEKGAQMLGRDLDFIITETIAGMQKVAEDIGLKGDL